MLLKLRIYIILSITFLGTTVGIVSLKRGYLVSHNKQKENIYIYIMHNYNT